MYKYNIFFISNIDLYNYKNIFKIVFYEIIINSFLIFCIKTKFRLIFIIERFIQNISIVSIIISKIVQLLNVFDVNITLKIENTNINFKFKNRTKIIAFFDIFVDSNIVQLNENNRKIVFTSNNLYYPIEQIICLFVRNSNFDIIQW